MAHLVHMGEIKQTSSPKFWSWAGTWRLLSGGLTSNLHQMHVCAALHFHRARALSARWHWWSKALVYVTVWAVWCGWFSHLSAVHEPPECVGSSSLVNTRTTLVQRHGWISSLVQDAVINIQCIHSERPSHLRLVWRSECRKRRTCDSWKSWQIRRLKTIVKDLNSKHILPQKWLNHYQNKQKRN